MHNKVFAIHGNKVATLYMAENALMLTSERCNTEEGFMELWNKKMSLATKLEIKYESIYSIKKEDNDKDIVIRHKFLLGIPSESQFSFLNAEDYDTFFAFLQKEKNYSATHEQLTPFSAAAPSFFGLVFAVLITAVSFRQAIHIADGTIEEAHNTKTMFFYKIIEILGEKGVLAVGAIAACYLLYKIWSRLKNLPHQLKLLPPNS